MGLTTSTTLTGCAVAVLAVVSGCNAKLPAVSAPLVPVGSGAMALMASVKPTQVAPAVEPVKLAAAVTPIAPVAPAAPVAPVVPVAAPSVEPVVPEAAPAIAFAIPGATEPLAAAPLFAESFADGLAAWTSRGLAAAFTDDALVLATGKSRRSLWIKTKTEIDLGDAAEPRLKLDFKDGAAPLTAVWETEHGAFPEEILLAAIDADDPSAAPEYDLSALRGRPGHLVLVARAPRGGDAAPVLDGVTIYDAGASR